MKCKEVMTRHPESIPYSSTARQTAHLMKYKNVGIVPVVDDQSQKLMGVVTDRDLCLGVIAEGRSANDVKVSELMTKKVIFCHSDDDIHYAESLMKQFQVRRVAVVDLNGYCVGIISQGDLALKVSKPQEIFETLREVSKPKKLMAA